jgi:hypothetical protein
VVKAAFPPLRRPVFGSAMDEDGERAFCHSWEPQSCVILVT